MNSTIKDLEIFLFLRESWMRVKNICMGQNIEDVIENMLQT